MAQRVILCLVNGPFQALSLVASLHERGLMAPQARPVVLLVDMVEGSSFHSVTARILSANGLRELHFLSAAAPLRSVAASVAAFATALGFTLDDITLIATYGVHRPIARFLISLAARADVLIYEDGLRAYVAPSHTLRERVRTGMAQAWGWLDRDFGKAWAFPEETGRSQARCILLTGEHAPPRPEGVVHPVSEAHLRAAMSALEAPVFRAAEGGAYVVIVGQYYARLKQMKEEDELHAYAEVARSAAARGQIPVWRGHIRERDQYYAALKERCPGLSNFSDFVTDASLPLELYASLFTRPNVSAVSFSSSSLFYLRSLYGIDTRTLVTDDVIAAMSYPHRQACGLAHRHIPPFSA